MTRHLSPRPLNSDDFAAFGQVIALRDQPDRVINQGLCGRHHDLADLDIGQGRAGISLFEAQPRPLPLRLDMVERHPLGSQAFLPVSTAGWLVIVAPDRGGVPGRPLVFRADAETGVNISRNVWHGVLCPLHDRGLFAVVDRIGAEPNLEEFWFDDPWIVEASRD